MQHFRKDSKLRVIGNASTQRCGRICIGSDEDVGSTLVLFDTLCDWRAGEAKEDNRRRQGKEEDVRYTTSSAYSSKLPVVNIVMKSNGSYVDISLV
ncbi:hypothetical protein Tco_1489053 [Tanacetum coccineum]